MSVSKFKKGFLWFFLVFVVSPLLATILLWTAIAPLGYTFTEKGTLVVVSGTAFFCSAIFRKQLTDTLIFPILIDFMEENNKDTSNIKANYLLPPIFTGLAILITATQL